MKYLIPIGLFYLLFRSYEKAVDEFVIDVRAVTDGTRPNVAITITNTNLHPFYISNAFFDVWANGTAVAKVAVQDSVWLGPNETVEIIPDYELLSQGVQNLLLNYTGAISFFLKGYVQIGPVKMPVEFEKVI